MFPNCVNGIAYTEIKNPQSFFNLISSNNSAKCYSPLLRENATCIIYSQKNDQDIIVKNNEKDRDYIINLAGYSKEEISVNLIDDNEIVVEAKHIIKETDVTIETTNKINKYIPFDKDSYDLENITSTYNNGLLTINIKEKEEKIINIIIQ